MIMPLETLGTAPGTALDFSIDENAHAALDSSPEKQVMKSAYRIDRFARSQGVISGGDDQDTLGLKSGFHFWEKITIDRKALPEYAGPMTVSLHPEHEQTPYAAWDVPEPLDRLFVERVRLLVAEADDGARMLLAELDPPAPSTRKPKRKYAKRAPVENKQPALYINNPNWDKPDYMLSSSGLRKKRKRLGICAGCLCPTDDFTEGCKNCYMRHYARQMKYDNPYSEKRPFLITPNRPTLEGFRSRYTPLAGPSPNFIKLIEAEADTARRSQFHVCAHCVTSQGCTRLCGCLQSAAYSIP